MNDMVCSIYLHCKTAVIKINCKCTRQTGDVIDRTDFLPFACWLFCNDRNEGLAETRYFRW